jgi:hypothetical protein
MHHFIILQFFSLNEYYLQANPEQSKHLETARMKIFDQWIDFVNLRTESYGDSRIPDMAFGTAMEVGAWLFVYFNNLDWIDISNSG